MDDFNIGFDDSGGYDVSDVDNEITDISDIDSFDDIKPLDDIEIADITNEPEPFINDFEQQIEELSLDDLNAERERLIELGALDGEELAQRYDDFIAEQTKQEQFDDITNGLSTEQLEEMKERLQAGDAEMLDIWKVGGDK